MGMQDINGNTRYKWKYKDKDGNTRLEMGIQD